MRQPVVYVVPGKESKVYRLRRSIYGQKQSARCWNRKLSVVLKEMGFEQSAADQCLFTAVKSGLKVYLVVYVDDFLVGCKEEKVIKSVYGELKKHFDINWLGNVKYFLGQEVKRQQDGIYSLSVKNYIEKLVLKLGLVDAKPVKTPMEQGYQSGSSKTADSDVMEDSTAYRSVVAALLYIAVCARPDIAKSASILGRKFSAPAKSDYLAAKRVVRYLKGTKDWSLKLGGATGNELQAFSDADWAGDYQTRKSTTGFVVFYAGGAVSWASRRQGCVSLSSMEAEYVALGETCQEVLWRQRLLEDLGEKQTEPTVIHEDNQGCLSFIRSERESKRSKHIDTKECFIRDLCEQKVLALEYCPTDEMRADLLTKPLGAVKHHRFVESIGLGG